MTPSVHLHAPFNKCLLNFISEVIKAEAEQGLLCRKKELKKENSPVEKFRKQLFRGYGLARVPAESPDK